MQLTGAPKGCGLLLVDRGPDRMLETMQLCVARSVDPGDVKELYSISCLLGGEILICCRIKWPSSNSPRVDKGVVSLREHSKSSPEDGPLAMHSLVHICNDSRVYETKVSCMAAAQQSLRDAAETSPSGRLDHLDRWCAIWYWIGKSLTTPDVACECKLEWGLSCRRCEVVASLATSVRDRRWAAPCCDRDMRACEVEVESLWACRYPGRSGGDTGSTAEMCLTLF
ncbi:hypothetical protein B0H67DRAFT_95948 [Lasiosphaeris hirsuta]|uniref:Uncharacterized protein n=1 Tax=Lasiosphaeris hirsuta TaxID=260670 RepID=A0AA40E8J1_9PEZI|nr:hypothetical protein B0H67DRAFT_95948 [Lasiosphaeris hirsuta]